MNRYLILATLLLSALSCSKVGEEQLPVPTEPNTGTIVSLTASLTDAGTRVSATSTADEGWTFAWDEEDSISAWYTDCTEVSKFTTATYDEQNSTFTGTVETTADKYRFIYPYEEVKITSEGLYTIDVSTQNGELAKSYLINDALIATTDITSGTTSTLKMNHLGGFMVVDVYLENFVQGKTYTLTKVSYSDVSVSADVNMTLGVDEEGFYNNIKYGTLSADVSAEFEAVEGSTQYLGAITRLNILPFTVVNEDTITVELTIEVSDDDGSVVQTLMPSVTLSNNSGVEMPFARATHNYTYLIADGSLNEIEITDAKINDWSEVASGEMETTKVYSYVEFKRNESATANMTKVDDAKMIESLLSKFRRCLMTTDGSGNATICYLDNSDSGLYNDGTTTAKLDGTQGDVMVYFPEYWYKYENVDNGYFRYHFSDIEADGYIRVEASLVGAYKAYNVDSMVYSRSGVLPTKSVSQADFVNYAAARGIGYQIIDYDQHCTIAMMLYAKYLDRNLQAVLGTGSAGTSSTTGLTNSLGNSDGEKTWVNGLGVEGVYGGVSEWIDGVEVNSSDWSITNPTEDTTRTVTAGSSNGYITALAMEDGEYFDMVPTASGGDNSTYYADYCTTSTSVCVVYRSYYFAFTYGGVSYANASNDSSYAYTSIGSRLAFRGTITEAASVEAYKALFNNND